MSIKDWPAEDRPREKLLKYGAEHLSDSELLAILLRTGRRGLSAVSLARELLGQFDGLRGILDASRVEFCAAEGLGDAKYAQLKAVMEMAARSLHQDLLVKPRLCSAEQTIQFLSSRLRSERLEVFCGLFLDNQHGVIAFERLFTGGLDSATVYPRQVVEHCLKHNAAAVIFAHNHPSGNAEPSHADIAITEQLRDALKLFDVRVLDHIVIGSGQVVSLAQRGLF